MMMIQHSQITSKILGQASSITLTEIMQRQMIVHCLQRHLCLWHHCLWWSHLRNFSLLNIAEKTRALSTNLKNISNSLLKISTLVIQFIGGWVNARNSQTSFVWLGTFYAFLVSNFIFNNSHLIHGPNLHRLCCCRWEDFLWWAGHNLPLLCQSPCQYHPYSDACQEAVASCTHASWYWTGPLSY